MDVFAPTDGSNPRLMIAWPLLFSAKQAAVEARSAKPVALRLIR